MRYLIVIAFITLIYPFQIFSQYFLGEVTKKSFLIIALNENQFDFVTLEKGTLIILNDQKPINGYFTCYDIESEKFGLIDSRNVKVLKEIIKQENSQIQSQSYSHYYEPRINIFNNTNIKLKLQIGGNKYEFKPKERKTIILQPKDYHYIASGTNVESCFGTESFKSNYEYQWEFYIMTKYR